jgi:hypothetical protein
MSLTIPAEAAISLVAGRSTGRLRWVAAGVDPMTPLMSGGETSVVTLGRLSRT